MAGAEPKKDATPRRIVMLVYPGIAPLDVVGPLQVFEWANRKARRRLYEIITVAPTVEVIESGLGFGIAPNCAMTEVALPIDTLLVSGGGGPDTVNDQAVLDWVVWAAAKSRRFGSICTGVFVLAAAGLVEGRRVTTHWAFGHELARRHPKARVEIDRIFVRDGNLCTSAGISAGIDLALALLEDDHGREMALRVARDLVLFLKRSGGQSQFSTLLRGQFSATPTLRDVQFWCLDNLTADISVSVLARRAAMSGRNFLRKFTEETGTTPSEFVISARLDAARRLLEESHLDLKAVALRCGIGSLPALRRLFLSHLGMSPAHYRDKFRRSEPVDAQARISQEFEGVGFGAPL